jgi:hypothetical protein
MPGSVALDERVSALTTCGSVCLPSAVRSTVVPRGDAEAGSAVWESAGCLKECQSRLMVHSAAVVIALSEPAAHLDESLAWGSGLDAFDDHAETQRCGHGQGAVTIDSPARSGTREVMVRSILIVLMGKRGDRCQGDESSSEVVQGGTDTEGVGFGESLPRHLIERQAPGDLQHQ